MRLEEVCRDTAPMVEYRFRLRGGEIHHSGGVGGKQDALLASCLATHGKEILRELRAIYVACSELAPPCSADYPGDGCYIWGPHDHCPDWCTNFGSHTLHRWRQLKMAVPGYLLREAMLRRLGGRDRLYGHLAPKRKVIPGGHRTTYETRRGTQVVDTIYPAFPLTVTIPKQGELPANLQAELDAIGAKRLTGDELFKQLQIDQLYDKRSA